MSYRATEVLAWIKAIEDGRPRKLAQAWGAKALVRLNEEGHANQYRARWASKGELYIYPVA